MIGRDRTHALVTSGVLSLAFIVPLTSTPSYAHHVQLLARSFASTADGGTTPSGSSLPGSTIVLKYDGTSYTFSTSTRTVGEFLTEQGIQPDNSAYVRPSLVTPVVTGMTVEYHDPMAVTLVVGNKATALVSSAPTVRALLQDQHVPPSSIVAVTPALDDTLAAGDTVRVTSWLARRRVSIAPPVIRRVDLSMASNESKVLSAGRTGLKEVTYRLTQGDGYSVSRAVVSAHVLRKPMPKIVAHGVTTQAALLMFAQHGIERALALAGNGMHMVATAYSASCSGCSGIAAIGVPAGHGVVAVDPRVIPLGSKLFIPGYGRAIAGDTGGSILGSRIDLGFNSQSEAMSFGTRSVTVYVLR